MFKSDIITIVPKALAKLGSLGRLLVNENGP